MRDIFIKILSAHFCFVTTKHENEVGDVNEAETKSDTNTCKQNQNMKVFPENQNEFKKTKMRP